MSETLYRCLAGIDVHKRMLAVVDPDAGATEAQDGGGPESGGRAAGAGRDQVIGSGERSVWRERVGDSGSDRSRPERRGGNGAASAGALSKKKGELREALQGRLDPVYRLLLGQPRDQGASVAPTGGPDQRGAGAGDEGPCEGIASTEPDSGSGCVRGARTAG